MGIQSVAIEREAFALANEKMRREGVVFNQTHSYSMLPALPLLKKPADGYESDMMAFAKQQLNCMSYEFLSKIYREKIRVNGFKANSWLREQKELQLGDLYLGCDDAKLQVWCERRVSECESVLGSELFWRKDLPEKLYQCLRILDRYGIEPPLIYSTVETHVSADLMPLARRFIDLRWWLRNARKLQVRVVDQFQRKRSQVARGRQVYASDWAIKNRWKAEKRNRASLEKATAINDYGQEYTLAELSDLGTGNLDNLRNELMTRIRGFEEVARDLGHAAEFWTITAASQFHCMTYIKHAKRSFQVENYNGANPRQVQAHLCKTWARIRAELLRNDIRCYGFRVVEPHHDGTPHWHLLLFFNKNDVKIARAIARKHALSIDATEAGAQEHRFTAIAIDPDKGTAAGYIAKYIAKNINGRGFGGALDIEDDESGLDVMKGAERVKAWASIWGIRQFQQIGGASVTVWRELRRLWGQGEPGTQTELFGNSIAEAAGEAATAGDWAAYTMAMGGALLPRADRPLKPAYWVEVEHKIDEETGEILDPENTLTEYGDPKKGQIFGVSIEGAGYLLTRLYQWSIKWFKQTGTDGFAYDVGRNFAPLGLV